MRTEEKNQVHRAFRAQNGYTSLLSVFTDQVAGFGADLRTEAIVESVNWRERNVKVTAHNYRGSLMLEAPKILVTVPLSLLKANAGQSGAIQFTPQLPAQKLEALDKLAMGKVIRVVLRLLERFWESIKPSARAR